MNEQTNKTYGTPQENLDMFMEKTKTTGSLEGYIVCSITRNGDSASIQLAQHLNTPVIAKEMMRVIMQQVCETVEERIKKGVIEA